MDMSDIFERAAAAREMDADSYRSEISDAVDRCYSSSDPYVLQKLCDIFPQKPSPEEFILRLALEAKRRMDE